MELTGRLQKEGLKAFIQKSEYKNGKKIPRIWVLVADKAKARIFRKPDGHLELIGEAFPGETQQAELTNRTIGRVANAAGNTTYHKYEPHMNQSRQDEFQFGKDLAEWLDQADKANAFDRLILIAAPRVLGDLRSFISKSIQSKVAAEIDKDLTKLDEKALYEALDTIVWF